MPNIPKTVRYTLCEKIDQIFVETIELVFSASYLDKRQKAGFLYRASIKLDMLKFFFQIAWEIKALDNKKYILLSERLNEIGRMLGGWQKQLK